MDKNALEVLIFGLVLLVISISIFGFLVYKGSKYTKFNKNLKKDCLETQDVKRYIANRKKHDWYIWAIVPGLTSCLGILFIVLATIRQINL